MKPGYQVIVSLVFAAMAWGPRARAASEENGVIIIARASYEFCPNSPFDPTVVVIASNEDLDDLAQQFPSGSEYISIMVSSEHGRNVIFEAQMHWVDHDHLAGVQIPSGAPLELVNYTYANRKGWLPKKKR